MEHRENFSAVRKIAAGDFAYDKWMHNYFLGGEQIFNHLSLPSQVLNPYRSVNQNHNQNGAAE